MMLGSPGGDRECSRRTNSFLALLIDAQTVAGTQSSRSKQGGAGRVTVRKQEHDLMQISESSLLESRK